MIKISNLVIGYNHKPILKPINLEINLGSWIGIVGQNGVGKSTFLKTIVGQIPKISGSILINGHDVNVKDISYIPQEREINCEDRTSGYTLIKYSYRPNSWGITLTGKKFKKDILNLIEKTQTQHYINQPFKELSGGQKKLIYLMQALINKPKVILLDEPMCDLDQDAKNKFIACLKKINYQKNITLLIVSHNIEEIFPELNSFIHFSKNACHYCTDIQCIKKDLIDV